MSNCLVKKLKSAASDSSLQKLGELRLTVYKDTQDAEVRFGRVAGDDVVGVDMDTHQTVFVLDSTVPPVINFAKTTKLSIVSKYQLKLLMSSNNAPVVLNLDELKGCVNLEQIKLGAEAPSSSDAKISGSIAHLASLPNLTAIQLRAGHITEDIRNYPVFNNLIEYNVYSGQNIQLSIIKSKLPNVTTLVLASEENISGDVSDTPNIQNMAALTYGMNSRISGNINAFANSHELVILTFASSDTVVTGKLSDIKHLATQHKLEFITLPRLVTYTASDKAEMEAAGCEVSGGTLVESYT